MSSLPAYRDFPAVDVEPVTADGLRVSEDAYWRDYYLESDRHYEWNDGRLEEKPVSSYETYLVYAWFTELLLRFLTVQPIASMVALEMGFRLPLRVLPGFRFRLADLARQPALTAMRDDALYRDFVLPEWQRAERRARDETEARKEAEMKTREEVQARKAAEQRSGREAGARIAAEQEVERLRALLKPWRATIQYPATRHR